jgi:hypothetical protein
MNDNYLLHCLGLLLESTAPKSEIRHLIRLDRIPSKSLAGTSETGHCQTLNPWNLPNIVNQADIFQITSHFLCMWGDVCLVRPVGNHLDATGKVIERTYCEVIVQRFPEEINDDEHFRDDGEESLSKVNKKCRRR